MKLDGIYEKIKAKFDKMSAEEFIKELEDYGVLVENDCEYCSFDNKRIGKDFPSNDEYTTAYLLNDIQPKLIIERNGIHIMEIDIFNCLVCGRILKDDES